MKTLYESILNIDMDNTQKATEKNQEFMNDFCAICYKYLGEYTNGFTQNTRNVSLESWSKFGCKEVIRIDLAREQFKQHPRITNKDAYNACVNMTKELDVLFGTKTTSIVVNSFANDFIFKTYKFQETCNISVLPIRFIKGVYKPFKSPFLFMPKIIVEILQNYKP